MAEIAQVYRSQDADMGERRSLRHLGGLFVRYANTTFGGGSATIAVLYQEFVAKRAWLNEPGFGLCYALSRVTPGTNLLAFCVGMGWLLKRLPGALVALLAASIPCSLLVLAVTIFFDQWSDNAIGATAIHGAMAAAVGITVVTCWTIAKPHVQCVHRLRASLYFGLAFGLAAFLAVSPIHILLLAAVAGFALPQPHT